MASSLETECPICREEFKMPKLLPCAHVLCRDCVLSWLRKADRGRRGTAGSCPLCRDPIIVTRSSTVEAAAAAAYNDLDLDHEHDHDFECESEQRDLGHDHEQEAERNPGRTARERDRDLEAHVDAFPTDHAAVALTAALKIVNGPRLCGLCDDTEAQAASYCFDCKLKLCCSCSAMHAKFPAFRTHVTDPLCSLTAERLASRGRVACCAHPDRYAELCCHTHRVAMCALCVPEHGRRDCRVEVLSEFAKGRRQTLLAQGKRLLTAGTELKEQISRLEQDLHKGQERFQAAQEDLNVQFEALHSCLEQRRSQLTQTIQMQEQRFTQSETDKLNRLKQLRPFVTHQGQAARRLAMASPDGTLLDTSYALQPRLDELEEEVSRSVAAAVSAGLAVSRDPEQARPTICYSAEPNNLGFDNSPTPTTTAAVPLLVDNSPRTVSGKLGRVSLLVSALSPVKAAIAEIKLASLFDSPASLLSPSSASADVNSYVASTPDFATTNSASPSPRLLTPTQQQSAAGNGVSGAAQPSHNTDRLFNTAQASAYTTTSEMHGNDSSSAGSGSLEKEEEEKVKPMAAVLEVWRQSGLAYHRADAAGAMGTSSPANQFTPHQQEVATHALSAYDTTKDDGKVTLDASNSRPTHLLPGATSVTLDTMLSSQGNGDGISTYRPQPIFPAAVPVTSQMTSSQQNVSDVTNARVNLLETIMRALASLDVPGVTADVAPFSQNVTEIGVLLRVVSHQIVSIVERHFEQQEKLKSSTDVASACEEEEGGAFGGTTGGDQNTENEAKDGAEKMQEEEQTERLSSDCYASSSSVSTVVGPLFSTADDYVSSHGASAACDANKDAMNCLDNRHEDEEEEQQRLSAHHDSGSKSLALPQSSSSFRQDQQHQQRPRSRSLSSPFTLIGDDFHQNDDANANAENGDDSDGATIPTSVATASGMTGNKEEAGPASPLRGEPEGCCAVTEDDFCSMRRQNLLNDSIEAVSRSRSVSDPVHPGQSATKATTDVTQKEPEKKDWLDMLLAPLPGRWLTPPIGTRVRRGPDWSIFHESVDGGPGGTGIVIRLGKGNKMMGKGWVLVRWNATNRLHWHRMGAEGCCDLTPA